MNLIELNRSLVQLRLSGLAAVMETRLLQAQSENMTPIDLISTLVSDELACRSKRLLERRHKQAQFRDINKRLDNFDFQFNPKMNRSLVFELATANWVGKREDALFLGPPRAGLLQGTRNPADRDSARGLEGVPALAPGACARGVSFHGLRAGQFRILRQVSARHPRRAAR